jgi:thioester reductase-like protein
MRETHLITGGTGFVGSAVILELLRQTDADVVAVVRPAGGSPRERLLEALGHAAAVYEADDELLEAIEVRCHAIGGDLGEPHCGVDPAALPPIRSVWHCAASLRYEDRCAREIFATNLEALRRRGVPELPDRSLCLRPLLVR